MKRYITALVISLFLFLSMPVYAYKVDSIEGIAVINTENLNVRSGPSKDYDRIGTLKKDTMVKVIGFVEPEWYMIEYGGKEGFIHKDYIIFTPEEETEETTDSQDFTLIIIVSAIAVVVVSMVITLLKKGKDEEEEDEETEYIPLVSHEDTNMHFGEVSYDTYRLDIDPIYFEQTTIIPQPESIYDMSCSKEVSADERAEASYESEEIVGNDKLLLKQEEYHSLDMKLEEATAQIAALQKEVEELTKNTESITIDEINLLIMKLRTEYPDEIVSLICDKLSVFSEQLGISEGSIKKDDSTRLNAFYDMETDEVRDFLVENKDCYYIYLLDEYKEFKDILSFFVIFFDYNQYSTYRLFHP